MSGVIGSYLACAEYVKNEDGVMELVNFKTVLVDGVDIKENTCYTLFNGEFIEVSHLNNTKD